MEELVFTWRSALKIFVGLLLFGVWLMVRQQAKMDQKEKMGREEAQKNGTEIPARRLVSQSNLVVGVIAISILVLALFWGNESTI